MLAGRLHALTHLHPLFRTDPAVAIGIDHVEMLQGRRLRFLQRHAAIAIGVSHLEHVATETAAHSAMSETCAVRLIQCQGFSAQPPDAISQAVGMPKERASRGLFA